MRCRSLCVVFGFSGHSGSAFHVIRTQHHCRKLASTFTFCFIFCSCKWSSPYYFNFIPISVSLSLSRSLCALSVLPFHLIYLFPYCWLLLLRCCCHDILKLVFLSLHGRVWILCRKLKIQKVHILHFLPERYNNDTTLTELKTFMHRASSM